MIKVSDYIIQRLFDKYGVRHVFMVTGGGAMHLNDAIAKCDQMEYVCNHHEQACAIAAEGYARSTGKMGVVNVTTGPGGLNTLTGVLGQWTDSVPVLYISGQVKQETTITHYPDIQLRQLGDQEVDIISIVKPITKFAEQITYIKNVKYLLDKAVYFANEGRPGPVWIDVPMDIQGAMMDENEQNEFIIPDKAKKNIDITGVEELLQNAERPLIVAGSGIKISGAKTAFLKFVEKIKIPVATTHNGVEIFPTEHPLFVGRIGTLGSRSGNFALQNADVVLTIGTRNNIRQVSYNWDNFVREGKLIVVDIDEHELRKPTINPALAICADAKEFICRLNETNIRKDWEKWIEWCRERKKKYPVVLPEYKECKKGVQPYYFIDRLTKNLSEESIVVAGNGSASVTLFQASNVKFGQQYIWNSGCAAMGYDLSAAIGASIGNPRKTIVCVAGDGSLMMNIQELATMAHHKLPIKLIILNNQGYISIKQTQDGFFNGNHIGCGTDSGISFPNFQETAHAFGLKSMCIDSHDEIDAKIQTLFKYSEPIVCEVKLNIEYKFLPKTSSEKKSDGRMISKPLEDLFPFLPREEFLENMIVAPLKE